MNRHQKIRKLSKYKNKHREKYYKLILRIMQKALSKSDFREAMLKAASIKPQWFDYYNG